MRIDDEPAWVLEARPYRETSLLLDLLTASHGRLAAVARGVRGSQPGQRLRRAALEPFQPLRVALAGRGEVLTLGRVDVQGQPLRPTGTALLSALYVNELIQKLTGRGDPVPAIFTLYGDWLVRLERCLVRSRPGPSRELADADGLAWALRRFERDLLAELGYGLALDHDADTGAPVQDDGRYLLDPGQGARPWSAGSPWPAVDGAVLLAWAGEARPDPALLARMQPLARVVIDQHLGGAPLRSRQLARQWRDQGREQQPAESDD